MPSAPSVRGVLLDIGGVVYVGEAPLPGAVAAVARLRAAGIKLCCLTNTTRAPRRVVVERLARMGVNIAPEAVLTPAMAARRALHEDGRRPHFLIHPALAEDFADLAPPPDAPAAVVVGDAGEGFTYAALNAAFRVLVEDDAAFLALARNRSFRDADGRLSLDAGAFVAALEYASARPATLYGKPAPAFFAAGLAVLGCAPDEAVMIGDDVEADIAGAQAAGIAAVLVRTGKYRAGDEARIDPPPRALAADLAAAVDWIVARTRG
ncbi:MAG: TIGR01458 family HAD-type hydrolase [Alphaproteobacteria bacterium]|nr:MAG: TIGR01458 family HAD-type hydrolase [Alphaproteobacteria bacterium]